MQNTYKAIRKKLPRKCERIKHMNICDNIKTEVLI